MDQKFLFLPVGTEKVEDLEGPPFIPKKFPIELRVQFAIKPV